MEKEIQCVLAFEALIKHFKEHIGYNNLTNADILKFKEYVKDVVELSKQPYYNQLIEEYFSKLPTKEENAPFNIYKAFEDKKKRIEAAQNEKLFKDKIEEVDKKNEDNQSFNIYSVLKRALKVDKDEDDKVSFINQYFVDYFRLYMIIETTRVNAYHYDRYNQTKLHFETVSNILAENTRTMEEHFHNLEVLQDFAKWIVNAVFGVGYHGQGASKSFDSFTKWIQSLTDREFEFYFGVDVQFNRNEFTLSSSIMKQWVTKAPQSYWRCYTNINNTLTWRDDKKN